MAKKEASPEDIQSPSDMKPILARAKHGDPASAAIALTKDKDGVILLDKKKKPKQLVAMLKKEAAAAGLTLEMPSMRFGRATISEDEPGLVNFVVNKEASGAMRMKLLPLLKKAGYQKCEISVDVALENESEEDEAEAQPEAAPAAAAAEPAPEPAAAAPAAPAEPEPAQAAAPAQDDALPELKKRLAGLMQHIPEVLAQAPDQKDGLVKLATAANEALKAADVAAATAAEDALEKALEAAEHAGAAAGTAAAAAPAGDAGAAGKTAAAATINKTSLAWVATRKAVEGQINTLHDKMSEAYKDHGFGADLDKFFKSKVEPVLEKLDESLVDVLKDASAATEPSAQKKLMEDAKKIIDKYEGYLASEPLIKQLDSNPFQELKIEATLTKTLSTLNKTLTSIAGSISI